jgi:hypothetical protein
MVFASESHTSITILWFVHQRSRLGICEIHSKGGEISQSLIYERGSMHMLVNVLASA